MHAFAQHKCATVCADILASEGEITVVTDYDPVLPDVSLDIDLEHDITLDGTEPLGVGTHGR